MNKFELTESETALVQRALGLLEEENFGSPESKRASFLKDLFHPYKQNWYEECGRSYPGKD